MGKVGKVLTNTAPILDGSQSDFRMGKWGDLFTVSPMDGLMAAAEEGSYFAAVNATDNTAITASIATAYSGTASGFISLQNTDVVGGKNIILDYIKLITKVVPASATDWRGVIDVDNVLARFTSGGTAVTPTASSIGVSTKSIATLNVGALTTVALSANGRTMSRILFRAAIPVALDTYIITFGGVDKPSGAGAINGTNPQIITYNSPPIVLAPNSTMVLSLFGTGNAVTAGTYQFEMGWLER